MKQYKKTAAAFITAALLVSVCTGCGSRGGKGATLEVSFDHSYSSEELHVDGISRIDGGIPMGDQVLVVGYDEDYNSEMYLYNMADGTSRKVSLAYMDSLGDDEEANPVSLIPGDDGSMSILYNAYSYKNDMYEDLGYTLETYDRDLNVTETRSLGKNEDTMNFYQIVPRKSGGFYAVGWDDQSGETAISALDDNLKPNGKISGSFSYIQNILQLPDGSVAVAYQDKEYNDVFGLIDEASGSVEKVDIAGLPNWFNECGTSTSEEYDFYVTNSDGAYGINIENKSCEEVINWLNSDFNGDYVNNVTQLPDGRFLMNTYNYMSDDHSSGLWVLSPRSEEDLKNMEVISIATLYASQNLRNAISEYNRSSDKYRIVVYDYNRFNTDEDYTLGQKQFENDLTSGIVPDIICVDNLPFESLCNKGLFTDLTDYMEDLTEDRYFTNYFDSLEYGGNRYRIGFSFSVNTLLAKTEHVGDGSKTIAEFTELIQNLPENMQPFNGDMTRNDALYQLVMSNVSSFVDVEKGTCTFNSPEFVQLLEFCNTFPLESKWDYDSMESDDWNDYWAEQDLLLIDDKALFMETYISDIRNTYNNQMTYFDNVPVTRTGFPTVNENDNGGRFANDYLLTISTASKFPDACWEFFEMMLSDDYQQKLNWSIPVSKTAFDKMAEKAMQPDTYTDGDGNEVVIENTVWRGDQSVEIPYMTQEYADALKTYICGITQSSYYDEQVYKIVSEEAEMYFSGDQSAQQTADMIQSRASLYLSEQR